MWIPDGWGVQSSNETIGGDNQITDSYSVRYLLADDNGTLKARIDSEGRKIYAVLTVYVYAAARMDELGNLDRTLTVSRLSGWLPKSSGCSALTQKIRAVRRSGLTTSTPILTSSSSPKKQPTLRHVAWPNFTRLTLSCSSAISIGTASLRGSGTPDGFSGYRSADSADRWLGYPAVLYPLLGVIDGRICGAGSGSFRVPLLRDPIRGEW